MRAAERLAGCGCLADREFVVAADLAAELVDQPWPDPRQQPERDPIDINEIIAKAAAAPAGCRSSSDAGRRSPTHAIVGCAQGIAARHVPVDPGGEDGLVAAARDFARQTVEESECGVDLLIGQRAAGGFEAAIGGSAIDGVEKHGTAGRRNRGKIAPLLIVTSEEEQTVLDQRAAACAAELIARIDGFQRNEIGRAIDDHAPEAPRIARPPSVVAIVEKTGAAKCVRPALRDGVQHTASGTAVFRRGIRHEDSNFANRPESNPVADARAAALFREEGLVVVTAVYAVVVQQAADAEEADPPGKTINSRGGRENGEVGPATAVVGKIVERCLSQIDGEVRRRGVDPGRPYCRCSTGVG